MFLLGVPLLIFPSRSPASSNRAARVRLVDGVGASSFLGADKRVRVREVAGSILLLIQSAEGGAIGRRGASMLLSMVRSPAW
jgi:hypothetical protein